MMSTLSSHMSLWFPPSHNWLLPTNPGCSPTSPHTASYNLPASRQAGQTELPHTEEAELSCLRRDKTDPEKTIKKQKEDRGLRAPHRSAYWDSASGVVWCFWLMKRNLQRKVSASTTQFKHTTKCSVSQKELSPDFLALANSSHLCIMCQKLYFS